MGSFLMNQPERFIKGGEERRESQELQEARYSRGTRAPFLSDPHASASPLNIFPNPIDAFAP